MKEIKHCLIIDDDEDDQEIFLLCVKKISSTIACVTANTGVDALALLEADEAYVPDYIFLDVNMPKMNGIACLKELKRIDRLRHTKIFMYSTTSESMVLKESKELGAHDFIVKPAKTFDLKEKLRHIFEIVSEIDPNT